MQPSRTSEPAECPVDVVPVSTLVLAALLAWTGCGGDGSGPSGPPGPSDGASDVSLAVEEVATGLSRPLHLTSPAGDPRLFVVEQGGTVRVVREDGTLQQEPYLDLTSRVQSGGEQGLLSLVFHPEFADNGRFFVNFTDGSGDTRVEEFDVDPAASTLPQTPGDSVLGVEQPYSNHNGGLLKFGPDGMLWIGLGDGGSGGDPQGNGQDPATLLGSMLRVDVDAGSPYTVPSDNPFVGESGRDEVFAYGLRNPWRFAFDRSRGLLYVADVGQSSWEEVSVIPADSAGVNFGWNVMEGAHCYEADSCDTSGLLLPVVEYSADEGCAIIGGEVYRGDAIPELRGHYFYADFCSLRLRSFTYEDGEAREQTSWDVGEVGRPLGFGRDSDGEVYLLVEGGTVYRFVEEGS